MSVLLCQRAPPRPLLLCPDDTTEESAEARLRRERWQRFSATVYTGWRTLARASFLATYVVMMVRTVSVPSMNYLQNCQRHVKILIKTISLSNKNTELVFYILNKQVHISKVNDYYKAYNTTLAS